MRKVTGTILFPSNANVMYGQAARISVLDISESDAPSQELASTDVENVDVTPGGFMPFEVEAPEVDPTRMLTVRVHVHPAGADRVASGDLITTAVCPVPPEGDSPPIDVPLTQI
jgi:putative lipoprotein